MKHLSLATALEAVGAVGLTIAALIVSIALGIAVAAVACVLFGLAMELG